MNKLFVFSVILFFFTSTAIFSAALSNRALLVDVDDETGRVFLSTIGGIDEVQGDEKKNLLFYDTPPSSYSVIYVNDDLFIYGDERGKFTRSPVVIGQSVEAVWENELISVRQIVGFIGRKATRIQDGVLITYAMKNKSDQPQKVGLRILFDTYLGEKGPYHFELSDGRKLEYETVIEGIAFPQSWVSKAIKNPAVCVRGVLIGVSVTAPQKIIFANYKTLRENLGDYHMTRRKRFNNLPYSKNDSAVALYYKSRALDPGETAEYKTILGLCGPGEYGEEEEVIEEVNKKEQPAPEEQPEPVKLHLSLIDIELVKNELKRIKIIRGSLSEINAVLKEVNTVLESQGKEISESELLELLQALDKIEQGER